jgi:hypothetical protein
VPDVTDPVPLEPHRAGVLAYTRRGHAGRWRSCTGDVVVVGTLRRAREAWPAYACDEHRVHLDDAHPLDHDERVERGHRRAQRRGGGTRRA